jgi:arylsulfatase A-like enzyme
MLAGLVACAAHSDEEPQARSPRPAKAAAQRRAPERGPGLPTVVLFVMDTVRADHTSLCGYDRDTTPFLASLAVRKGPAVASCDLVTPGSWTVPSHASFFTGLAVAEHGDDAIDRVLPADVPTLAEAMRAKGYQTLMVSANPTLSPRSGLQRGFDRVAVAPGLASWRGEDLTKELKKALALMDPAKPLFLFVNAFDAHDPFLPIPDGVEWAEPQPRIHYDVHNELRDKAYFPFVRGKLPEPEARDLLRRITDAYDVGVREADANVRRTIGLLVDGGWTRTGFRVVVTADHGEYLGERQRLRHGCELDEAVTRVPLLVYEPDRKGALALPDVVPGRQVFWIVRDGALSPDPVEAEAFAVGRSDDPRHCEDVVARWPDSDEKLVWRPGGVRRFDLKADRKEEHGKPVKGEAAAALEARAKVWQARRAQGEQDVDGRRREEMKALGYAE